jgi:hypothetical protein
MYLRYYHENGTRHEDGEDGDISSKMQIPGDAKRLGRWIIFG